MPPFYFVTGPDEAEKIKACSPAGAARIYPGHQAQDWMRGALGDTGDNEPDTTALDFLANEVIEAILTGNKLMHVETDNREALQQLAVHAEVEIQPLN